MNDSTLSNGPVVLSNLSAEGKLQQYLKEYGVIKCTEWIGQKVHALNKTRTPEFMEKNKARAQLKRTKQKKTIEELRRQLEEAKQRLAEENIVQ